MIPSRKKLESGFALVVAGLLLAADTPAAETSKKAPPSKAAVAGKRAASPKVRSKARQSSTRSRRRARRSAFKRHLARLRMPPERAAEIQQALVQAGYLKQEPNGKWDDATRDAMRRYQADHGFPTTGLPEAKTLMKLGLGPHPLPPEVDPSAQPRASAGSPLEPASADTVGSPSPSEEE